MYSSLIFTKGAHCLATTHMKKYNRIGILEDSLMPLLSHYPCNWNQYLDSHHLVLPVFELDINGTRHSFPLHSVMRGPGMVHGAVVSFLSVLHDIPASVDAHVFICSCRGAPGELPVRALRQILPWTLLWLTGFGVHESDFFGFIYLFF